MKYITTKLIISIFVFATAFFVMPSLFALANNNTAEDPDDPLDVLAAAPGRAYGFDGCEFGTTGCNSGWGNYAKIFHGAGKYTIYAHLESVAQEIIDLMPDGLLVPRGYVIGQEGSTGNSVNKDGSRADHIHFGLHGGDPLGDSSGTSIP